MKSKKSTIFYLAILCLVIVSLTNISAIKASIGNSRMTLYPEFDGSPLVIERTILAINDNNVSINVSLKPDEDGEKFIEVIDKDLVLAPGEEKKAKIKITIDEAKRYEGKVYVFFSPEDGGTGVVLSSTIVVNAGDDEAETDNEPEEDNPTNFKTLSIILLSVFVILLVAVLLMKLKYTAKK